MRQPTFECEPTNGVIRDAAEWGVIPRVGTDVVAQQGCSLSSAIEYSSVFYVLAYLWGGQQRSASSAGRWPSAPRSCSVQYNVQFEESSAAELCCQRLE